MTADATADALRELVAPQVEGMGYELWGIVCQLSARRGMICIYIDHADGIGLADCEAVSEQVSGLLDVEDLVDVPYRLEVSSPGLDRLLLCPEHFLRYRQAQVSLRLRYPVEGRRKLAGVIEESDNEEVRIMVEQEAFVVPYRAIAQARLQYTGEDLEK